MQASILTEEQLLRVMDANCHNQHAHRDKAIILLSYHMGLRVIELAALRIDHVRDAAGQLRNEFWLDPQETKGKFGRTIYVSNMSKQIISNWLKKHPKAKDSNQPLFPSQKGGHFRANTLCQWIGKLYAKAGLDNHTSHSGRRTFCTNLVANNVNLRMVQALAGHRHIQTTVRYVDTNSVQLLEAVNTLR